jgi:hypothetical protein
VAPGIPDEGAQVVGDHHPRLVLHLATPLHDEDDAEERDLVVGEPLAGEDVQHAGQVPGHDECLEPAAPGRAAEGHPERARRRRRAEHLAYADEAIMRMGHPIRPSVRGQCSGQRVDERGGRSRVGPGDQDRHAPFEEQPGEPGQLRVEETAGHEGRQRGEGGRHPAILALGDPKRRLRLSRHVRVRDTAARRGIPQRREMNMIQRLVAVTIGGLVTFGFLVIWDATNFMDPIPAYAVASILGAVGALIWPVIVGWWFVRRRRNKAIEREVGRQMSDK